jgi:hypothetical protein
MKLKYALLFLINIIVLFFNNAIAYTNTAKLIATTDRAEIYIYTGSVKRVDKVNEDYSATSVVNMKNIGEATKSYFQNKTFHCADKTSKQMTMNVNVGHTDLWASGAITSDSSPSVGKRVQIKPTTANEIMYDFVCASSGINSPSLNVTKENSKQINNTTAETMEQQMQRQINERNLNNQRRKDIEDSKSLAFDKDIEIGIKYVCKNYSSYLFLRGVVYEGSSSYQFEKIKSQLERKHGINQVEEGTFKFESGIFKFNMTSPSRYVELHTKENLIYIRWLDQITKHSCEYRGGDFSRFNK